MKKRKTKKLWAMLLSLAMLLGFAACGGGESEQNGINENSGSSVSGYYNDIGTHSSVSGNKYQIGEYITFGKYEQDNDTSNGAEDIEWLVLDVKDGKALVFSKYGLEYKRYNEEKVDTTWETCTLRNWLNNDFYSTAFTNTEKNLIATTGVIAENNPDEGTEAGNDTQDKLFLLSISEVKNYCNSTKVTQCKPTNYLIEQDRAYYEKNNYNVDESIFERNCLWWFRTPGESQDSAAIVNISGYILEDGYDVSHNGIAVRPAMWINVS